MSATDVSINGVAALRERVEPLVLGVARVSNTNRRLFEAGLTCRADDRGER